MPLDYGLALALPRFSKKTDDSKSLRIELRDYYTFANPTQHNIMLRVGWMGKEEQDKTHAATQKHETHPPHQEASR